MKCTTLLLGLLVLCFSSAAHADEEEEPLCPAGKVVSAETKGHCCWPSQTWNEAGSYCTGRPTCPAGMTRDGLTCTAGAPRSTVSEPKAAQPPRTSNERWDTSSDEPPPPEPRTRTPAKGEWTKSDYEWWGKAFALGGLAEMGTGYVLSLELAIVGTGSSSRCRAGAGVAAVPLFGPISYSGQYPPVHDDTAQTIPGFTLDDCTGRGLAAGLSVISEVLQLGGATASIAGFWMWNHGSNMPAPGTVSLLPGAAGAPLGATLRE